MRVLLALLCGGFFMLASPANAFCDDAVTVLNRWQKNFGEIPTSAGRDKRGYVVMVLVNPETGKFSIFAIEDAVACLLGTGEGWKQRKAGE